MVVTKRKVFWSRYSDSHEKIISEYGLREMDVRGDAALVRIEITPPDIDWSTPPRKWQYQVDQDILPGWYDASSVEKRVRTALKSWRQAKLIGCGMLRVEQGLIYAYGSATVKAYDSATVKAYGSATVEAYGSATVEAYDSATVKAYGSATVEAYGSATVKAYDSATVKAYGSATVEAYNSATVEACGSATIEAYDSATVKAYDSATVIQWSNNVKVVLLDLAACICRGCPGTLRFRRAGKKE
jgi:hypothetical protein